MEFKKIFYRIFYKILVVYIYLSYVLMSSYSYNVSLASDEMIYNKEYDSKNVEEKINYIRGDSWITGLSNISSNRVHMNTEVIDGKIYMFGGAENSSNVSVLNYLDVYNPEDDTWSSKNPLPTGRLNPGSVVFNNKIYCISGLGSSGRTNVVEVYDPTTDSWSTKTPIPTARDGFVAEVVNGKIYCIGGRTSSGAYTSVVEVYDIENNSWETKTPLSVAKGFMASAVVGEYIYCIGGTDGNALNTLEIYNTKNDTWETKDVQMPTNRYASSAAFVNNKIYVIGGRSSSYFDTVESYDISTNSWETKTSMPTIRAYAASSVIDNKIYVFGGYSGSTYLNTVEAYIVGPTSEEVAEEAVAKAEDSRDIEDISNARDLVDKLDDSFKKDELIDRLNAIYPALPPNTPQSISSNIDIYIKLSNTLSISLDTNSIIFDDFTGVEDMIKENAINLTVESSLPYEINASLVDEIKNADGTQVLNKSILSIKANTENNYITFTDSEIPIVLLDVQEAGEVNTHGIDLKLNKNIIAKTDVYRAIIRFEAKQK